MYFTNDWVSKISQNLFHSLTEGGWLIVSSCELSSNLFPKFTPVNFPGAVLYRKGKEEHSTSDIHSYDSHSQLFLNTLPSLTPAKKAVRQLLFSEDSNNSALKKDDRDKIGTLIHADTVLKDALEPQPQLKTREDVLNENKVSIRVLASQGHLEEALSLCNEAIASDKLDQDLYFLRASIFQELNKSHEAIKSLKQAIFINSNYIIGHLTLGNLFKKQGNFKNAKRHFINALELLNTVSNDDIPEESYGFSAKHIREIILDNLDI
jgi:chemotaxis protein methyltransferase CheR